MVLLSVLAKTALALGSITLGCHSVTAALDHYAQHPESAPKDYVTAISYQHRASVVGLIEDFCPASLESRCLAVANVIRPAQFCTLPSALDRVSPTVEPVIKSVERDLVQLAGITLLVLFHLAVYLSSRSFRRHCQLCVAVLTFVLAVVASIRATPFEGQIQSGSSTEISTDAVIPVPPAPTYAVPTIVVPSAVVPVNTPSVLPVPKPHAGRELAPERNLAAPHSMLDAMLAISDSLAPVDQAEKVELHFTSRTGTHTLSTTLQYAVVDDSVISAEMPSVVALAPAGTPVVEAPTASIATTSTDIVVPSPVLPLAAACPPTLQYAVVDDSVISAEMPSVVSLAPTDSASFFADFEANSAWAESMTSDDYAFSFVSFPPTPAIERVASKKRKASQVINPTKFMKSTRFGRRFPSSKSSASVASKSWRTAPSTPVVDAEADALFATLFAPIAITEPVAPSAVQAISEEETIAHCADIEEADPILALFADSAYSTDTDSGYDSTCNVSLADIISKDQPYDFRFSAADLVELEGPSSTAAPVQQPTYTRMPGSFFTSSWDQVLPPVGASIEPMVMVYPSVIRGYLRASDGRHIKGLPSHDQVANIPSLSTTSSQEVYLGLPATIHPRPDADELLPVAKRLRTVSPGPSPRLLGVVSLSRFARVPLPEARLLRNRRRWEEICDEIMSEETLSGSFVSSYDSLY